MTCRRGFCRAIGTLAVVACVASCERGPEAGEYAARETAELARQATFPVAPGDSSIPDGPLGASIRRGRAILLATRDSLPAHVRANLRCTSCHLEAGTRPYAAPLLGVYVRFPQYRDRIGRVSTLEDRVNDCFERSLNGVALTAGGADMRDIVAFLAFLSRGMSVPGDSFPGLGLGNLGALHGDSASGRAIYATTCARCHGADGHGNAAAPALWGPRSYNVGASMARNGRAAAFIKRNMPYDRPGTLSDQQAYDVATFVNTHSRPDLRGKENDWPRGGAPPDIPYTTRGRSATAAAH